MNLSHVKILDEMRARYGNPRKTKASRKAKPSGKRLEAPAALCPEEAPEVHAREDRHLVSDPALKSPNREAAARGQGHVWWVDGVWRGPPVDPR